MISGGRGREGWTDGVKRIVRVIKLFCIML